MGSTCTSDTGKVLIPIYDYDQIRSGLAEDSLLVVDVREENEMITPGRIPGSKHIPLNEVAAAFGELSPKEFEERYQFARPEKDSNKTPLVITCRSGMRAGKAADTILALGYPVGVYKGSMNDWTSKGGKVLSGEKVTDFEDVQRILEEKSKLVIDVRNPNEFSKGRIPGAHNLPLPEIWTAFQLDSEAFESKYGFAKPDLNDQIVVHCLSGKRARMASDKMTLLNFENVDIYKGSFSNWKARGGEVLTDES